jgi:hypothetical protein
MNWFFRTRKKHVHLNKFYMVTLELTPERVDFILATVYAE